MSVPGKILVTGSAGRIGQAVVGALQGEDLRGIDRLPTPGISDHIVGDVTGPTTLKKALQHVHTVIHLAATPDDEDDFLNTLLPNNIVGVYHLLEQARLADVKRLILASSAQVVWHQRLDGPHPISVETVPTPRYWYAATKLFLEGAGRAFAKAHEISVFLMRLGWCPRTIDHVREIAKLDWAQDCYLSPADAGRFFRCAVHAPMDIDLAVFYAAGRPVRKTIFDLEPAKRLLGYEPKDSWPDGIKAVTGGKGLDEI